MRFSILSSGPTIIEADDAGVPSRAMRDGPGTACARRFRVAGFVFVFLFMSFSPRLAQAFPPAPPHMLYGTLRDEYGTPMSRTDARVVFESLSGAQIVTRLAPGLPEGTNYEILIPMDAGVAPGLYRPDAMLPLVPFRLKVIIGNRTYLPIEMSGNMHELGKAAGSTRLDLTLGIDSDGDGIPDAYKDMVIAMMGGGLTRADIRPNFDLDGDGMTVMQEYIAGTYPWDANDRLFLNILHYIDGKATLEFFAIDGRSYQIEASTDLVHWQHVPFRVPAVDAPGAPRLAFLAKAYRRTEIEVSSVDGERFYRLRVR
jgi:hypothetical protein